MFGLLFCESHYIRFVSINDSLQGLLVESCTVLVAMSILQGEFYRADKHTLKLCWIINTDLVLQI